MDQNERQKIIDAVKDINTSEEKSKETVFKKKYSWLKEKYPNLYRLACNENIIDSRNLGFMLEMLEKMEQGTTQEKASEEVGKYLFNEYVATVLPEQT